MLHCVKSVTILELTQTTISYVHSFILRTVSTVVPTILSSEWLGETRVHCRPILEHWTRCYEKVLTERYAPLNMPFRRNLLSSLAAAAATKMAYEERSHIACLFIRRQFISDQISWILLRASCAGSHIDIRKHARKAKMRLLLLQIVEIGQKYCIYLLSCDGKICDSMVTLPIFSYTGVDRPLEYFTSCYLSISRCSKQENQMLSITLKIYTNERGTISC